MADLSKVPLVALSIDTKILISTLLNPTKWLLTDDGLPRDWRGLAHLWGLDGEKIPSFASQSDPTGQLLTFAQNNTLSSSFTDFQSMLSKIDRWDVIEDAQPLLERDAEQYVQRMEKCKTSVEVAQADLEKQILTMDDLYRVRQGMKGQCYDAFVLYAEEDVDFVTEMINVLEEKRGLKLCLKDRDLMGGIPFEHEAVMQLISERCNRLIVIISPDFLKSSANAFFLNYAQAVGIGTGQRKIIPCLYKKCQLPPQLAYQFILDYSRNGLYDFWGRLHACVQVIAQDSTAKSPLPTQNVSNSTKNDELKSVKYSVSPENDVESPSAPIDSLKKINGALCTLTPLEKPVKTGKTKKLIPWPKRKKDKSRTEKEKDPVTESVSLSLSLPSLQNLPQLDSLESTTSSRPSKRKKNLVGACVNKVQSLLSKQ